MRLAKAGYYGGDPQRIMEVPVGAFVSMLEYESFEAEYEAEYIALNKADK